MSGRLQKSTIVAAVERMSKNIVLKILRPALHTRSLLFITTRLIGARQALNFPGSKQRWRWRSVVSLSLIQYQPFNVAAGGVAGELAGRTVVEKEYYQ